VQCFACDGKISSWRTDDEALLRHRHLNSSCPFILNCSSNVSISSSTEAHSIVFPTDSSSQASPSLLSASSVHSQNHHQIIPPDNLQENRHIESHNENHITPDPNSFNAETRDHIQPFLNGNRSYLTHQEWSILKQEDLRLRTFDAQFSASFLSPLTLARAGFFYLGVADQVQCVFCRGVIGNWEVNDDPCREHLRHFPTCPFMLGLPVGNVVHGEQPPIHTLLEQTGSLPIIPSTRQRFDSSSRFTPQYRPNASSDTEPLETGNNSRINALISESLEELGITKHQAPRYATYATRDARLKSFTHWPSHLKQTPRMMAEAGFFYLGVNDHVKCFHCDGGLRNWEPNDDPWMEHAQWFPRCGYLILVKGDQYIKDVAESMPSPSAALRCSRSNPPPVPLVTCRRSTPREVSEEELRNLLDSTIAQTVLSMGVDLSRVKQAIQYKMRTTGCPFNTVDSLLEAAIEVQHYSEHRQAMEDPNYETVEWSVARPSASNLENLSSESSSWESETTEAIPCPAVNLDVPPPQPEELKEPEEPKSPVERTGSSLSSSQSSDPNRTQALEEEIRRLKEARLCKVCLDEDVSVAYIPCGHIVTCVLCAAALDQCPLCRKNIKGTVRVFFS